MIAKAKTKETLLVLNRELITFLNQNAARNLNGKEPTGITSTSLDGLLYLTHDLFS